MLDGRFVRAPNEIVLGRRSLRALHKHIGDTVEVVAGPHRAPMRITGVMLGLSAGSVFNGRLDEGGAVTLATLKRLEPGVFVTIFFVTYVPGVDRRAALASIKRDFGTVVLQRTPAQDVQDLAHVDALPGLLAALLVLLAIATLAHNLLASVRRRRRAVATLKVIGLERPQLAAAVLWQMWALAMVGVVVGVPLGVLLGRWAWRFVATQIGSVQQPAVPVAIVGVSVLIAAIITTLVAIVPAVTAARVQPATALRQE